MGMAVPALRVAVGESRVTRSPASSRRWATSPLGFDCVLLPLDAVHGLYVFRGTKGKGCL